jgi:WD40 repeat protein
MNDFSQKPKRKREGGKNPTMYLVSGIVIGVLVTAFLAAGFLFLGVSTDSQVTFDLPPTIVPTATPIGFVPQSVPAQATVIAHRVNSARLSPNGRFLVTIVQEDMNPVVYLSELAVQRNLVASQRYTIPSEGGYFTNAIFSPASDKLVITGESGRTIIIDTTTREIIEELSPYSHAAFNDDGTLLALAGNGDGIRILDANSLTLVAQRELNAPWIGGLVFTSANELLVAYNLQVDLLSPTLDAVMASYTFDNTIFDIAIHPSSEWFAVASEGYVQVVNLNTQERTHYTFETARIHTVAFNSDGTWLAAGGGDSGYGDGRLYAFRWNQSNVIPPDPNFYDVMEFMGNQHIVNDVTFTYNNLLLSAAWDGSVRLWDVSTGEEVSRLQL